MRILLALFLGGCVSMPERITLKTPAKLPLATFDARTGDITLTPLGMAWLRGGR